MLPWGYFYFGASAMIPTCPLLEIHDVTWAIRLIGVLRVVTILPPFSILSDQFDWGIMKPHSIEHLLGTCQKYHTRIEVIPLDAP